MFSRKALVKLKNNQEGTLLFVFLSSRKDLVQVEATVIEKTESWPKINMRFKKRKNYKRKRSKLEKAWLLRSRPLGVAPRPVLGQVGRGPALCQALLWVQQPRGQ